MSATRLNAPYIVLFDNDSQALSGAITLSESAANFERLTICYKTNDGDYASVDVMHPDGKTVSLHAVRTAGTTTRNVWLKSKTVKISGTYINTNSTASGGTNYYQTSQVRADGSQAATAGDYIAITQVLGYR